MFKVTLKRDSGFTEKEWADQLEAAYWWAKCWNDPNFQRQIYGYSRTVTICTGHLWWKKCQTNMLTGFSYTDDLRDKVLTKMLGGSEVLSPEEDGEADVEIEVGNQRGVLGWTYPNTLKEWVSRWFIDGASIAEIAGNRAHEYMHKLGYDHPFRATAERPDSVPYAVGYLTEAWIEKNYVPSEFKPKELFS